MRFFYKNIPEVDEIFYCVLAKFIFVKSYTTRLFCLGLITNLTCNLVLARLRSNPKIYGQILIQFTIDLSEYTTIVDVGDEILSKGSRKCK